MTISKDPFRLGKPLGTLGAEELFVTFVVVKIVQLIARIAFVYCLMKSRIWTWPIKPPCDRVTNLVKYYTMLGGNERRPTDDALRKRTFPRRARSAEKKKRLTLYLSHCYSPSVISFSGFPEHWITFYQVCYTIAWRFARFYSKTKAIRGINHKIKLQPRSQITPLRPVEFSGGFSVMKFH